MSPSARITMGAETAVASRISEPDIMQSQRKSRERRIDWPAGFCRRHIAAPR
jgi:hypothetical protein